MKRFAVALLASTALALQPAYGQTAADGTKAAIGTSGFGLFSFGGRTGIGYFDGTSAKPKSAPVALGQMPHVANSAALAALPAGVGRVVREGAFTGIDGGGGEFNLGSGACPAADGFSQVALASGGCATLDLRSVLSQRTFGGICDGTSRPLSTRYATLAAAQAVYPNAVALTDEMDGTAIQALLNAVGSSGRAFRLLGPTCLFNQPLTYAGGIISGSGEEYKTKLVYNGSSTTVDLLAIGVLTANTYSLNNSLANIVVDSNTKMTAGTAIHLKNVARSSLHNVVAAGQDGSRNLWNGFWFDQIDFVSLVGYQAVAQNDAIRANGTAGSGVKADLVLLAGKVLASGVGLHIGGAFGGLTADNSDVIANGVNVLVDSALAAEGNRELFFGPTFVTDSAQTGDNYLINDTRVSNSTLVIAGWSASAKLANIHIQNWPASNVSVSAPEIFNGGTDGIRDDDASARISISGATQIHDNQGYGVNATVSTFGIIPGGSPFANAGGNYSALAHVEGGIGTANGYRRDNTGTYYQWGQVRIAAGGAANTYLSAAATFPVPCQSAVMSYATSLGGLANGANQTTTEMESVSLTGGSVILASSVALTNAQKVNYTVACR